ncbi:MAG: hypothetical protein WC250_03460 [Candidatus Paceibacterota bacterium]|jgi:hypothetical protein
MPTAELVAEPRDQLLSQGAISDLLQTYGISTDVWGHGTARSFADLLNHHKRDQLFFRPEESRLVLDVNVAMVLVYYQSRGRTFELYEDRQEFPDGSILHRDTFDGIGETMGRREIPIETARRCLAEELNFRDPSLYQLSEIFKIETRPVVPSEKWPNLFAAYHRHIFECFISPPLYRRRGYAEIKDGRTIHFRWKRPNQMLLSI